MTILALVSESGQPPGIIIAENATFDLVVLCLVQLALPISKPNLTQVDVSVNDVSFVFKIVNKPFIHYKNLSGEEAIKSNTAKFIVLGHCQNWLAKTWKPKIIIHYEMRTVSPNQS